MRIGTASVTSRGMGKDEMVALAGWIDQVVSAPDDAALCSKVSSAVSELCSRFTAPGIVQD